MLLPAGGCVQRAAHLGPDLSDVTHRVETTGAISAGVPLIAGMVDEVRRVGRIVLRGEKNRMRNLAIQARYPVASLCSRCDRTAGHSAAMMLYTQVSRNVPLACGCRLI